MMKFYRAFCLSFLLVGSVQVQSAPQVNIKEPLVEFDEKVFGSDKITVLVSHEMRHGKTMVSAITTSPSDTWVLSDPVAVRIGDKVYVRGTAENGPEKIKGKVIMFEMRFIKMIVRE